jgi:hypothetical protein
MQLAEKSVRIGNRASCYSLPIPRHALSSVAKMTRNRNGFFAVRGVVFREQVPTVFGTSS